MGPHVCVPLGTLGVTVRPGTGVVSLIAPPTLLLVSTLLTCLMVMCACVMMDGQEGTAKWSYLGTIMLLVSAGYWVMEGLGWLILANMGNGGCMYFWDRCLILANMGYGGCMYYWVRWLIWVMEGALG